MLKELEQLEITKMKTVRILILEDDLRTLAILLQKLSLLEKELRDKDIGVTILSEYSQVEEYLNKAEKNIYDIILLDRDCKACGSFHCLDFGKYKQSKIISISSVPDYNEQAKQKGVKSIVFKDYSNLDEFADKVLEEIKNKI